MQRNVNRRSPLSNLFLGRRRYPPPPTSISVSTYPWTESESYRVLVFLTKGAETQQDDWDEPSLRVTQNRDVSLGVGREKTLTTKGPVRRDKTLHPYVFRGEDKM